MGPSYHPSLFEKSDDITIISYHISFIYKQDDNTVVDATITTNTINIGNYDNNIKNKYNN